MSDLDRRIDEAVDETFARRARRIRRDSERDYSGGIFGKLPTWIPEKDREQFRKYRDELLDASISPSAIIEAMNAYDDLVATAAKIEDTEAGRRAEQRVRQFRYWLPAKEHKAITFLRLVREAWRAGRETAFADINASAAEIFAFKVLQSKGGKTTAAKLHAKALERAKLILEAATEILKTKPHREVIGILERKDKYGSRPTIRKALEAHSSGHWSAKKK